MKTANDIIQHCIARLSMVSGTSVQKYAEDKLFYMIVEKYEALFEERFWKNQCFWKKFTLDGASGTLIENIVDYFDRLEDIEFIVVNNNDGPLAALGSNIIPDDVAGSTPCYYMQNEVAEKVVKIVPYTSTGTVNIRYRKRRTPIKASDFVYFDESCIVYAVCADYLSDDGDSANAQKFNELFHQRLLTLKANETNALTTFDSSTSSNFLTSWGG